MKGSLIFTLSLLLFTLSSQGLTSQHCTTHEDKSSTLEVLHVNSQCLSSLRLQAPPHVSWEASVVQMLSKDQSRLQYLASLAGRKSIVPVASGRQFIQSPTYIVRAKIGTPPQTLLVAVDTSSDAAWLPCTGCVGCSSTTLFASSNSTTFNNVTCGSAQCNQVTNPTCDGTTCGFNLTYGGSSVGATLSQDTLTLTTDAVPAYTFGCVQKASGSSAPPQGLLGLGRGPLSLLTQTQSLYHSTFSYCLPSYKSPNFSGSLRLGLIGQPNKIKYTQLLRNPRRSSLYYVNLIGVKVGRKVVDIPQNALAFNPTTGAGTIIDSGTVFTRLVAPAYTAVRDEFRRGMGNATVSTLGGFDTCYTVPVTVPTITFMFSGMNVTLPQDNFLIHSSSGTTTCLALAASPADPLNSVLNIIANWQQQNHRILFDVPNSKLGIAREACS